MRCGNSKAGFFLYSGGEGGSSAVCIAGCSGRDDLPFNLTTTTHKLKLLLLDFHIPPRNEHEQKRSIRLLTRRIHLWLQVAELENEK